MAKLVAAELLVFAAIFSGIAVGGLFRVQRAFHDIAGEYRATLTNAYIDDVTEEPD